MNDDFKVIPKINDVEPEISENKFTKIPSDEPISEEVLEKAQKIITDNDEIAEFNKEVLGQLESPLIVHKKGDASYEDCSAVFEMNETHNDDSRPTLKRHRFKKTPKKSGGALKFFVIIIVVAAAVFAGLCYSGVVDISNVNNSSTTSDTAVSTTESTTTIEQKYSGTIVIKKNYIFVDGKEVDGIKGLQEALKYKDVSTTAYEIIIEGTADEFSEDFYNYEVYPYLVDMGFIGEDTKVEHIQSTGLIAQDETTTKAKKKKKQTEKKNTSDENTPSSTSENDN